MHKKLKDQIMALSCTAEVYKFTYGYYKKNKNKKK